MPRVLGAEKLRRVAEERLEALTGQARIAAFAVASRLLRGAPSRAWIDMPWKTVA
jgi:hypothetical protein